jgi:hypothetical protein
MIDYGRWKHYYFKPKELELNADQLGILRDHFDKSKKDGYMWNGAHLTSYYANLDMLSDVYPTHVIDDLDKLTQGWEFCTNHGPVPVHVDNQRVCAVSIAIHNEENLPLTFYNYDNSRVIETLYYDYKPSIFRTREHHEIAGVSESLRVLMTGSIMHESLDDIIYQYNNKKLFKDKS